MIFFLFSTMVFFGPQLLCASPTNGRLRGSTPYRHKAVGQAADKRREEFDRLQERCGSQSCLITTMGEPETLEILLTS